MWQIRMCVLLYQGLEPHSAWPLVDTTRLSALLPKSNSFG